MTEPDTYEMSQHLKRLVATALNMEEHSIESRVEAIPLEDGSYICHLNVMLGGREPTKEQERLIVYTVQRYGFPGIRVTSLHVPAEA